MQTPRHINDVKINNTPILVYNFVLPSHKKKKRKKRVWLAVFSGSFQTAGLAGLTASLLCWMIDVFLVGTDSGVGMASPVG